MHVSQLSFSTRERNAIFRMSKTFDTSGISSAIDGAARRTAVHSRLERCYSLSRTASCIHVIMCVTLLLLQALTLSLLASRRYILPIWYCCLPTVLSC